MHVPYCDLLTMDPGHSTAHGEFDRDPDVPPFLAAGAGGRPSPMYINNAESGPGIQQEMDCTCQIHYATYNRPKMRNSNHVAGIHRASTMPRKVAFEGLANVYQQTPLWQIDDNWLPNLSLPPNRLLTFFVCITCAVLSINERKKNNEEIFCQVIFTTSINRLCRFSFYCVYIATITKIQFYPLNRKPSFCYLFFLKGLILQSSCRYRLCRASSPTACDASASCRHPWRCCRDQGLRLHGKRGAFESLQTHRNWNDALTFHAETFRNFVKFFLKLGTFSILIWYLISNAPKRIMNVNDQRFRVWKDLWAYSFKRWRTSWTISPSTNLKRQKIG